MTSYDGATFTWEGRSLASLSKGGSSYSYQYNADGIRTGKTVNGTVTEYFLSGSQILAQKTGNSVMWFFYDSQGTRTGLVYSGHFYYYLYNVQGDVVALADSANGQIVARYDYDAWGKCTVTNASGSTVGDDNPFRYRGYYYDTETGLYYLNSRYYDPELRRFINADCYISTGRGILGSNMFAYCNNNPVMGYDPNGCRPFWERNFGNGVIGYTDSGTGDYKKINGQQLEPYKSMSYGYSSIGFSGCEAIACYNALVLLGRAESFDRVKSFFTERFASDPLSGWGAVGLLGGTPSDVSCFLKSRNIAYQASGNLMLLNNMADEPGVIILMYWNKPIYYGYHTVAVNYDGSGYLAYNQDVLSKEPVTRGSISDYMSNDWRFMYGYYIPYQ